MKGNARRSIVLLTMLLLLPAFAPTSHAYRNTGRDCIEAVLTAVEENDAAAMATLFAPAELSMEEIETGLASLRSVWNGQEYTVSQLSGGSATIYGDGSRFNRDNYRINTAEGKYTVSLEYEGGEGPILLNWFVLLGESNVYGAVASADIMPVFSYMGLQPVFALLGAASLVFSIWCLVCCCKRKPPHWKGWAWCIFLFHVWLTVLISRPSLTVLPLPIPTIFPYIRQIIIGLSGGVDCRIGIPAGALLYCYSQWRSRRLKIKEAKKKEAKAKAPAPVPAPAPPVYPVPAIQPVPEPVHPYLVQKYRWVAYIPGVNAAVLTALFWIDTAKEIKALRFSRWVSLTGRIMMVELVALAIPALVLMLVFHIEDERLDTWLAVFQFIGSYWLSWEILRRDVYFTKQRRKRLRMKD